MIDLNGYALIPKNISTAAGCAVCKRVMRRKVFRAELYPQSFRGMDFGNTAEKIWKNNRLGGRFCRIDMNEYEFILKNISALAEEIIGVCAAKKLKISAAESCTGGMISAALTSVSGSSAVIELGVCAYSNRVKREILGVSEETLREHTEYSARCAEEMARGAARLAGAELGISTSGIAGPSGATESDPVGTVYIGCAHEGGSFAARHIFEPRSGEGYSARDYIRAASTEKALEILKLSIIM